MDAVHEDDGAGYLTRTPAGGEAGEAYAAQPAAMHRGVCLQGGADDDCVRAGRDPHEPVDSGRAGRRLWPQLCLVHCRIPTLFYLNFISVSWFVLLKFCIQLHFQNLTIYLMLFNTWESRMQASC